MVGAYDGSPDPSDGNLNHDVAGVRSHSALGRLRNQGINPFAVTGMITMKMISKTRKTSISGVEVDF